MFLPRLFQLSGFYNEIELTQIAVRTVLASIVNRTILDQPHFVQCRY